MVVNDLNPFWTSIIQAATHQDCVQRDNAAERHPLWFSTTQCYYPTNRVGLGPAHSTTGILAITARIPWYSESILHFSTTDRPAVLLTRRRPGHALARPGHCLVRLS